MDNQIPQSIRAHAPISRATHQLRAKRLCRQRTRKNRAPKPKKRCIHRGTSAFCFTNFAPSQRFEFDAALGELFTPTHPEIDDCATGCDKVIVNGRLIKNITYKTAKEFDCKHELHRVCGDVRHCTVEIPFHLFVDIPGTREGDTCEVEDAIVDAEFDKLIDKNHDGTFCKLLEKAVIKVRVKTVRTKLLKVTADDVTPPALVCPEFTHVQEVEGLEIPEEEEKKHHKEW